MKQFAIQVLTAFFTQTTFPEVTLTKYNVISRLIFFRTTFKKENISLLLCTYCGLIVFDDVLRHSTGTASNENVCFLFFPRGIFPSEVSTHGTFLPCIVSSAYTQCLIVSKLSRREIPRRSTLILTTGNICLYLLFGNSYFKYLSNSPCLSIIITSSYPPINTSLANTMGV